MPFNADGFLNSRMRNFLKGISFADGFLNCRTNFHFFSENLQNRKHTELSGWSTEANITPACCGGDVKKPTRHEAAVNV